MVAAVREKVDFVMIVPFQEKAAFGPRLLDAFLQQHGFNASVVYFKKRSQEHVEPSENEVQLLLDYIQEVDPLLIGWSLLSPFRQVAFDITRRIKKMTDTPVVFGGVHATIDPDDCMLAADIACVGDGEEPLRILLEGLKQGELKTDTPNCFIRVGEEIIKNPMTYMCRDMDSLPFPDLSGHNKFFVHDDKIREEDPYITYILKTNKYDFKAFRGCPYNCTFCGNKTIRIAYKPVGKFLRERSPADVIEELRIAKERFPNLEHISTYDEVFVGNKDFIREFSNSYKKEIGLPLSCDTYVTLATEEMVQDIVEAGLTHVAVGVESFSEEIRRKLYKRRQPNADILKGAWLFGKYGLSINYDFIMDNPYETHEDLEQCFWELIVQLPRPCGFNLYSLSHLPHADLTEHFLKEGIIHEDEIVGFSDKGLVQWKATKHYERDPRVEFWMDLMRLFSRQISLWGDKTVHIPRFVIKSIGKTKSRKLLDASVRCGNMVEHLLDGTLPRRILRKLGRLIGIGRGAEKPQKSIPFSGDPHYEH